MLARCARLVLPATLGANPFHHAFECLEAFSQSLLRSSMPIMFVCLQKLLLSPGILFGPKEGQRGLDYLSMKQLGVNPDDFTFCELVSNAVFPKSCVQLFDSSISPLEGIITVQVIIVPCY